MFYSFNNHLFEKGDGIIGSANVNWVRYINLTQTSGGTITAIPLSGRNGDNINLSYTANNNYIWNGWSNTGGNIQGNTFTFGDSDANIQGNFVYNPGPDLSYASASGSHLGYLRDDYKTRYISAGISASKAVTLGINAKDALAYKITLKKTDKSPTSGRFLMGGGILAEPAFETSYRNGEWVGVGTASWGGRYDQCYSAGYNRSNLWGSPLYLFTTYGPTMPYTQKMNIGYDPTNIISAHQGFPYTGRIDYFYNNGIQPSGFTIKYVLGARTKTYYDDGTGYERNPVSCFYNNKYVFSGYHVASIFTLASAKFNNVGSYGIEMADASGHFKPASGYCLVEAGAFSNVDDAYWW